MNKHYCECVHINGTLRWTKEGDASDAQVTVSIKNDKINIHFNLSEEKTTIIPPKPLKIDSHKISQLVNVC